MGWGGGGRIVAIKFAALGEKKTKKRRERWLRGTKEGDVHLPVERSPASPTAGAAPPRDRARGAGSEGTQVIEVSPPSLHPSARSPHPASSSPPPPYPHSGHNYAPHHPTSWPP